MGPSCFGNIRAIIGTIFYSFVETETIPFAADVFTVVLLAKLFGRVCAAWHKTANFAFNHFLIIITIQILHSVLDLILNCRLV